MRTTIDKAGRIVIPKELRDQAGIVPGPVDVQLVGNAIQIEVPNADVALVEEDGLVMIDAASSLTVEGLRELRLLMQDPLRGRGERDG